MQGDSQAEERGGRSRESEMNRGMQIRCKGVGDNVEE